MKALFHFTAPLLALITMIACTELEVSENPQNSNNELLQKLSITGKDFIFDGETRSAVTIGDGGASFTWDEDDVIGIFPDKGDQVSFAMNEGAGTQTATFSGGGWALKSSSTYAAYYPHVYENRDMAQIPVSYVGQAQNGNANTDHIGAYDFMAAGVSTPENGAVAFDMQHLGALVQLTITVPEPSTLSKVVLNSTTELTETGTIDLTAGTPVITAVTQSHTFEIALNELTTTEAKEKVMVYFMTAPVDLTDSELTATIHFADESTCEIELSGKNFEAGKAYRFAAEVKMSCNYIDEYGVNHGKGTDIDGVVWAPVNCGYHATDYPWGKLYQWGRKFGQGYDGDATTPTITKAPVSLEVGNDESNSNVFYIDPTYQYGGDWLISHNHTLWNSGTDDSPVKTEHDPCPLGWRVPTYNELNVLCQNRSTEITNNVNQSGFWFSGTRLYNEDNPKVFLPCAGWRSGERGETRFRGTTGAYWSSLKVIDLEESSYYLEFNDNYAIMDLYYDRTYYS